MAMRRPSDEIVESGYGRLSLKPVSGNRVIQDVDGLAVRPVQPDPLQRQPSAFSGLCFIDEVVQAAAVR